MASWLSLTLGVKDASSYVVDKADNVQVETRRIQVDVSKIKLETKGYRVVILKNVSTTNVYVSTNAVDYITLEPGAIIGVGLEVVELDTDLYLWADSQAVVEALMIR